MSSWLLLFGLGVAWAVVLVPDMIRRNVASRRSDTIGQFARNLGSLQQSAPVGVGRSNLVHFPNRLAEPMAEPRPLERVPQPVRSAAPAERGQRRSPVQQRRQDVLTALVAAAVLSFLGSISIGGALIAVNAVIDVAFVLYLGALLLVTRREKLRSQVGVLYQAPHQFSAAQFGRPMPAYVERQRVAR